MLRKPMTAKNAGRTNNAIAMSKIAPVRGWNAVDPITAVPETEAIVLDNWFPRQSYLQTRYGSKVHIETYSSPVVTLMPYTNESESKLFAATADGIYDATAPGTPGVLYVILSSLGKMQHIIHSVQGGTYLLAVNGVDELCVYNGLSWQKVTSVSTPIAITGVDTTTFVHVNVYKRRVFFIINQSMSFAYLPPAVVGGVAATFPLDGIFVKGGYLMAMGTWSLDSGNGADDHAVFLTSEGEVAVYTGSDPGDATNWRLVGVYTLAPPLSRRCMCSLGGDLLLVLRDGIYPMSAVMQSASIDRRIAITNKVDNAWQDAALTYSANFGWCAYVFREAPFLLCNIPGSTSTNSVQYVMNTTTKAWTRFTGMGGVDFAVLGTRMFMCRGFQVCEIWAGTDDFGVAITFRAKTGYSNFGYEGRIKSWSTVRPVVRFSDATGFLVGLDVDFEELELSGSVVVPDEGASLYDVALWDVGVYGPDYFLSQRWTTVASKPGYYASTKCEFSNINIVASWFVTNYIFQLGGLV